MQKVQCKGCGKIIAQATVMVAAIKCNKCYMIFEYYIVPNTLHVTNQFDMKQKRDIIDVESERPSAA